MKNNSGMPNISNAQIDMMLKMASKKLGVTPDQLKSQLQKGDLPQGLNAGNVQQFLNDPKKIEELLNTDNAKKILKDLMNGK
ncbi:hypothetical protein EDD70_0765 [Hydrogenoanaerobacterium saccharovorans]|uniref:Uncharacterized protein n=1 Tax=Hydrogenoanaerobacterium saccharovorans TaxID=474960 RepID=A0A1H8AH96_9FIRM|nr:hypothetical protein [Hydrogenoanaerobacterium saccharovorans]RPF47957.1 hypothetical protein EDD70_0765 [Hydrogenoanaerobacterium saccharovorans]SEM69866.1 hypothetical protein SAMN05216180_1326 [Hydrogenoanaerobacterium saccharovorans]